MQVPLWLKLLIKAISFIATLISFFYTILLAAENPIAWSDKIATKLIGMLSIAYSAARELRRGDGRNGGELGGLLISLLGMLIGLGGDILRNPFVATIGWLLFAGGGLVVAWIEYRRPGRMIQGQQMGGASGT